ncbi:unnamed protein product, partial [Rotaria sp. Silwood1]
KIYLFYFHINLIEGESGRLNNQSIISFISLTITTIISSTTRKRTITSDPSSSLISQQLSTSCKLN